MNSAAEWCGSSRCAAVPQPAPEICWNGPSEVPSLVGGIFTPDSTIAVSHAASRTFGETLKRSSSSQIGSRSSGPAARTESRRGRRRRARRARRRRRVPVDELDLQERVGQRAGRAQQPAAEAGRRRPVGRVDVHVVEVVLDLPQRVEAELDEVRADLVDDRRLDARRVVEVDRAGVAARVVVRRGLALAAGRARRPAHGVLVRRDRAVLLEELAERLTMSGQSSGLWRSLASSSHSLVGDAGAARWAGAAAAVAPKSTRATGTCELDARRAPSPCPRGSPWRVDLVVGVDPVLRRRRRAGSRRAARRCAWRNRPLRLATGLLIRAGPRCRSRRPARSAGRGSSGRRRARRRRRRSGRSSGARPPCRSGK